MPRLIDADALLAKWCKGCDGEKTGLCNHEEACVLVGIIECVPTIDAVPVVHGRWETYTDFDEDWEELDFSKCSICGNLHYNEYRYCPSCGAKMDGEEQSQKTPLKTLRCVYAESAKENGIGEELVWCERTGRWMNVSLGECYGQCESQDAEVGVCVD